MLWWSIPYWKSLGLNILWILFLFRFRNINIYIRRYLGEPHVNTEFICGSCTPCTHSLKVTLDSFVSVPVSWRCPITLQCHGDAQKLMDLDAFSVLDWRIRDAQFYYPQKRNNLRFNLMIYLEISHNLPSESFVKGLMYGLDLPDRNCILMERLSNRTYCFCLSAM